MRTCSDVKRLYERHFYCDINSVINIFEQSSDLLKRACYGLLILLDYKYV